MRHSAEFHYILVMCIRVTVCVSVCVCVCVCVQVSPLRSYARDGWKSGHSTLLQETTLEKGNPRR